MTTEPVVITRQIKSPIEKVFAAWTDPAQLSQWFAPESGTIQEADIDLRPGGAFKIAFVAESDRFCAFGTYLRIDSPRLLEFTWKWEESSIERGESVVTIELVPTGNVTELTLTHAKLESATSCEAHLKGWDSVLGRLATYATASTP